MEIVAKIKAENPKAFGKVADKTAARFIKLALAEVGKQVAAADEGVVRVPGLGSFRIKQVEKEKAGTKVKTRKVMFTAPKPAAAGKKPVRKTKKAQAKPA